MSSSSSCSSSSSNQIPNLVFHVRPPKTSKSTIQEKMYYYDKGYEILFNNNSDYTNTTNSNNYGLRKLDDTELVPSSKDDVNHIVVCTNQIWILYECSILRSLMCDNVCHTQMSRVLELSYTKIRQFVTRTTMDGNHTNRTMKMKIMMMRMRMIIILIIMIIMKTILNSWINLLILIGSIL